MAGVTEVAILYLIANSIKLHCDYCIFTGNAVPLNTCFDQLNQIDPSSIFKSYKFICNGQSNGILQLDYTNSACLGLPYQTQVLHNIIEYGCSNNNGIVCSSDKYVLVDLINAITDYYSEIGYILNKCVSISSSTSGNSSKFTQCTDHALIEWVFDDIACTSLTSIDIYPIGSSYQFPNVILDNINYCPSCTLTLGNYIVRNQVDLQVNYIVTNDLTYTFPEPMGVCNQFIYNNDMTNIASYEYSCDLNGNVYKSIWNNTNCTGLFIKYERMIDSIDYIDYNCDNYRNMLSKSETIQPSSVQVNRYTNIRGLNACAGDITSDWSQISYITNYCIQQNEILWVILESHDEFMIIHHYSDAQCQIEISECMILWKTNDCNPVNDLYFDTINDNIGPTRTIDISISNDIPTTTTKDPAEIELSIDISSATVLTNYIDINHYKEPINICNEYIEFGFKHSYKFVCVEDINDPNPIGFRRKKIKKRKWKNRVYCDQFGDIYDEEDDIENNLNYNVVAWSCNYPINPNPIIQLCKVNCFKDDDHFEQKSVILNNCIQVNDQRNSIFIECYFGYTMTYYYYS